MITGLIVILIFWVMYGGAMFMEAFDETGEKAAVKGIPPIVLTFATVIIIVIGMSQLVISEKNTETKPPLVELKVEADAKQEKK